MENNDSEEYERKENACEDIRLNVIRSINNNEIDIKRLPDLNSIANFITSVQKLKELKHTFRENQHHLLNIAKRLGLKRFLNKEFERLFKQFTLKQIVVGNRATLELNFQHYSIRQLVESIIDRVLPAFLRIEIKNIECIKKEIVWEFIENSVPQNQENFTILKFLIKS